MWEEDFVNKQGHENEIRNCRWNRYSIISVIVSTWQENYENDNQYESNMKNIQLSIQQLINDNQSF